MYFELQLSAAVFARVIRNRLRAIPLALDLSVGDGDDGTLVVDQVVIGDQTTVQREMAMDYSAGVPTPAPASTQSVWTFSPTNLTNFIVPYLQIRQEVKVLLVRASDLEANGPAATPPAVTVTIFPVFNVSLDAAKQTQGGGPLTLTYKLAYVDFGVAALELDDMRRAQIAQIASGLTIASSVVDLGAMTKLLKRPVAAINAGIACDPSGTRVALRADFDVYASPIAVTRAFFEAGPADLLSGKDWAMLLDAEALKQDGESRVKAALEDKVNLRILSDPAGSWDPGETTLHIGADIKLLGACPSFVDDIDMDVRLALGARFAVPAADHLDIHYHLGSALTDDGQVFGCALTGALLYPFAGAALLEQKKIDLKEFLGGIAFGPYFTFGQLVGVINAQKLEDDISSSLGDTCHKASDSDYDCTTIVNLAIRLVPTLNSRFVVERAHGVPEGLVISGPVANLGELSAGAIGDIGVRPFAWHVLGACTGNGKNNFHIGNEAFVLVPYTPPAKVVAVRVISTPTTAYTLSVDDNEIKVTPAMPPMGGDCKLRIITTRGVRTLTFAAAKAITPEEADALETAELGAAMSCFHWEREFTTVEKMLWKVDPAFGVMRDGAIRQWQVLVKSLPAGSKMTVRTLDGVEVLSGRPARSGTLQFSLTFDDADGPEALSMELARPQGSEVAPLEMSVRQTLYSLRASIPIQGKVQDFALSGSLRRPSLAATTERQSLRWDVSAALAPQLTEATDHSPETEGAPTVRRPVGMAGRTGTASPAVERALEGLRDRLGVPQAYSTPRLAGVPEALYLRTERGAAIYDISGTEEPRELQTLSRSDWFENTVASMNLVARHDPARQAIDLFEATAHHTV